MTNKPTKARKTGYTLFKESDNRELNLTFDFSSADAQEILNLAAETLVIRFRVTTKAKTAASYAAWRKALNTYDWLQEIEDGKINVNVGKWLRPKPATVPMLAGAFASAKNMDDVNAVKDQLLALNLPEAEVKKASAYHILYVLEDEEATSPT